MFKDRTTFVSSSFPKHAKYKPSGVDWLGEVPHSWAIKPLRNSFSERRETVSALDFTPLSVSKAGVTMQLESAVKSADPSNRKLVRKGDFAINSRSDRKGSSGTSELTGSVSTVVTVLIPSREMIPSYAHHLFRSNAFKEEFFRNGHGIHWDLWTTRFSDMKNILVPVPSEETQFQIANFLDAKTKEIEEAVKQKQRTIELLEEYKHSLIEQAVTKGLDPLVPMKDSEVDWLGEVPEHWERKKIKLLFEEASEKGHADAELLSVTQSQGVVPRTWLDARTVLPTGGLEGFKFIRKGEFAISLRSFQGGVEICHYDGIISPAYTTLRLVESQNKQFWRHLFKSHSFIQLSQLAVVGIREGKTISYPLLRRLSISFPPNHEQEAIVNFLDAKTKEIEEAKSSIQVQIDRLKEYKDSLIESAVTGKINVA